jgi:hypothetical protein
MLAWRDALGVINVVVLWLCSMINVRPCVSAPLALICKKLLHNVKLSQGWGRTERDRSV